MPTYNPPTLSGYNFNPPTDDGTESVDNQLFWDTIKKKLPDPLKTFSEAINVEVANAFALVDAKPTGTFVNDGSGGPYVSNVGFDIIANLPNTGAYENIGPTGSSATNIWTALDSLPATAQWIECRIVIEGTGGNVEVDMFGSSNSGVPAQTPAYALASAIEDAGGRSSAVSSFKLPVDSAGIFNLLLSHNLAPGTLAIDMYLTGYGNN